MTLEQKEQRDKQSGERRERRAMKEARIEEREERSDERGDMFQAVNVFTPLPVPLPALMSNAKQELLKAKARGARFTFVLRFFTKFDKLLNMFWALQEEFN